MKVLKRGIAFCLAAMLLTGAAFTNSAPIGSQVEAAETTGGGNAAAASVLSETPDGGTTSEPTADTPTATEPSTDTPAADPTAPADTPAADTPASTEPAAPQADSTPAGQSQPSGTQENAGQTPAPEVKKQEAMELKQEIKDAQGNVICTVTANIKEDTFEANTSEVTMKVSEVSADLKEQIEKLAKEKLAEDKELGDSFLYKVEFQVNGTKTEPSKEVKLTFQPKEYKIDDVKKANVFYYNEANSPEGNEKAEIKEIIQKQDQIEALQKAGQSTENIDDYDLTEISLKADGTADKIVTEGRRSTVYGCYLEEDKPEEEVEEKETATKEDDKIISSNQYGVSLLAESGGDFESIAENYDNASPELSNEWQIVSGRYNGHEDDEYTITEDGMFRLQKKIIPTDIENEFYIYLNMEPVMSWKEVFQNSIIWLANNCNEISTDIGRNTVTTAEQAANTFSAKGGACRLVETKSEATKNPDNYSKNPSSATTYTVKYICLKNADGSEQKVEVNMYCALPQTSNITIIYAAPNDTVYHKINDVTYDKGTQTLTIPRDAWGSTVSGSETGDLSLLSGNVKPNTVTDVMGDYINFLNVETVTNGTCSIDGNKLTWNKFSTLDESDDPDDYAVVNGKYYRKNAYQLVYKVTLDVNAEGFQSCKECLDNPCVSPECDDHIYDTNASTTLNYSYDTDDGAKKGTEDFISPVVRGVLPDDPSGGGEDETYEDVPHTKTIDYLGDTGVNTDTNLRGADKYRLYLDVTGIPKVEPEPADILLILDYSSSMDRDYGNSTRFAAVKQSARTAVNTLLPDSGHNNRVGIVWFDKYVNEGDVVDFTNNKNALLTNINSKKSDSGTNYQAAFIKAQELLETANNKKFVIFVTDGEPYQWIKNGEAQSTGTADAKKYATEQAKKFKNLDGFYAVSVGPDTGKSFLANNIVGNVDANIRYTFEANDQSALAEAFSTMLSSITKQIGNVTIQDKLSDYVELVDEEGNRLNVSYPITGTNNNISKSGIALKVTVKDKTSTLGAERDYEGDYTWKIEMVDGKQKVSVNFGKDFFLVRDKVYTISFNVQLTDKAYEAPYDATGDSATDYGTNKTSSGKEGLYSNSNATVTYERVVDGNYKTEAEDYDKPVVQVPELWQLIKVKKDNPKIVLPGAEFSLTKTGESKPFYYGTSNGKGEIEWKATDSNGEPTGDPIDIKTMSSGSYTLKEEKAPQGYSLEDTTWTVVISWPDLPTIKPDENGADAIEWTKTDGDSVSEIKLENEIVYKLPSTGGPGIYWYLFGGMLLMMAASLIVYKDKRREVLEK